MSNTFSYKLAGLTCRFSGFRDFNGFNNWRWKLDPYQTMDAEHPDLLITEDKRQWAVPEEETLLAEETAGFYAHRLYKAGNGHLTWTYEDRQSKDVFLAFDMCTEENRITLLCDNTDSAGTLAEEYLGRLLVPLFLKKDLLTLHGVLIEAGGQGIILSAPSGTGKTTHARLWRDYRNALILNGDRASVRKTGELWYGYGLPWSGTSGEQINRQVPIKAIVVLERDCENTAGKLEGMQAFEAVLPHIQVPAWDRDLSGKALDLTLAMLADIPVIRLRCRPDIEAVEVLEAALKNLS